MDVPTLLSSTGGVRASRRCRADSASRLFASMLPARFRPAARRVAAAELAASACDLRTGFIYGEAAASELAGVQLTNRRLRLLIFDEREAARPSGRRVAHDRDRFDRSGAREQFVQLGFADFVGQIADVQLSTDKQRPLSHLRPFRPID